MWEDFKAWLAVSPIASGLRTAVALGAVSGLNFIMEQYTNWGLPLVAQLAVASVIPPIIRALNDADGVFGAGVEDDDTEADETAEELGA